MRVHAAQHQGSCPAPALGSPLAAPTIRAGPLTTLNVTMYPALLSKFLREKCRVACKQCDPDEAEPIVNNPDGAEPIEGEGE